MKEGGGYSSYSSHNPSVLARIRCAILKDVLKEFIVWNTYIYPPRQSLRKVTTYIMGYTSVNMPLFNSVSVSGYHMHEAQADTALELAFTISNGLEYVRTAVEVANLKVDDVALRLSCFQGIGMNFYTEITNIIAGRKMWAKLMKEQYQLQNSKSLQLREHYQTSGYSLIKCQTSNNVIPSTMEVMLAVMGGHIPFIPTRTTRR